MYLVITPDTFYFTSITPTFSEQGFIQDFLVGGGGGGETYDVLKLSKINQYN